MLDTGSKPGKLAICPT